MKHFFTVLLLTTAIFGANAQVKAQKIGYISLPEIISNMAEGKKADTALQQHYDALVANATDKQNALQADIQKFIKDSATYPVATKEVKRRDLQTRTQELSGEEQRIQQAIEQKRQELSGPIEKKALDTVQAVAKENGYTYVLAKEAVIVGPPGDDLISLVKKKLGIK